MLTGVLMAVGAGLIWSLSGVANSCCARFKLDIFTYLLSNVFFSMALTGVLFVDFRRLGDLDSLKLACVMIPSGFLNTGGALMLQKALRRGHHGIVFLISQSALVTPFLFGVLVMGEKTTVLRCCGAALILAGMVCCALPRIQWRTFFADNSSKVWLLDALVAFLFFGVAQSLMTLPSYWEGFQDGAQARTTLIYLGFFDPDDRHGPASQRPRKAYLQPRLDPLRSGGVRLELLLHAVDLRRLGPACRMSDALHRILPGHRLLIDGIHSL